MHDSAWGRMLGVLVSPTRTFQSIAERPTWVVPLVVLFLLGALSTTLVFQKIDMQEVVRDAMAKQGQQLDDAQIEQISGFQGKLGYGCALIIPLVSYPLVALLLMGGVSVLGGNLRFPTSLSTTLYGFMPWAVVALLTAGVALSTDQLRFEDVQAGSILADSPAAFLPSSTGPVTMALMSSFSVFSLWTLILMSIGVAIVGKISRGKATALVVGLLVVFIGFKVGMAALGSAFGGG